MQLDTALTLAIFGGCVVAVALSTAAAVYGPRNRWAKHLLWSLTAVVYLATIGLAYWGAQQPK